MKNIRFLLLMVVAVLMGACDKNDDPIPTPPVEKTEMTVMAYFVADNNLDQYLKQNITMMCEGLVKINKPATLLVYWDGKAGSTYWSEPCILKYVTDGEGRLNGQDLNLKTAGGSYDTKLWDAAEVIPTEFTASTEKESMAGVLKQMLALSPSSDYYGLVAGSHGSGWLKYITGSNSRSFGQDGALTNTISTADMAEAVAAMGKKLDFFFLMPV